MKPFTKDISIILLIWFISLLIVNPVGNIPLNDDWSYGLTVKHLVDYGEFRPTGWTSMPLMTHIYWGYLFCLPKGFSFNSVRFSTIVLSTIGILCFYYLLKKLKLRGFILFISIFTLIYNPIYFSLTNTFMTDVSFTIMILIAVIFFIKVLKNDFLSIYNIDYILSIIFIVISILNRQLAIAIPISFFIAYLLKTYFLNANLSKNFTNIIFSPKNFSKNNLLLALLPLVISLISLLTFERWLIFKDRMPNLYMLKSEGLIMRITDIGNILNYGRNTYIALLYSGWFLFPILILVYYIFYKNIKTNKNYRMYFLLSNIAINVFLVFLLFNKFKCNRLMPLSENIINLSGIGPFTIQDSPIVQIPLIFWYIVTIISLIGASIIIQFTSVFFIKSICLLLNKKLRNNQIISIFLIMTVIIYLIPIIIFGLFDRYLIPVLPLLIIFFLNNVNNQDLIKFSKLKIIAFISILIITGNFLFSVLGTIDYFTWNRLRWDILNELVMEKEILPEKIDGGFEFNGLYLYKEDYIETKEKNWWWVVDNTYMLSFRKVDSYKIIAEYTYKSLLPLGYGKIKLLYKE